MKLTVATCQFPTDAVLHKNMRYIIHQMRQSADRGADVAHFSELALSGYAGVELRSNSQIDWPQHDQAMRQIMDLAAALRLWVIVGAAHRLSGRRKPHNSLYIISDRGRIVDRYDKMFCTGDRSCRTDDLAHYTPGEHFSVFKIKGVICGALICHDFRYDELYRKYYQRSVKLMFHSYHNAGATKKKLKTYNIWGEIVPATMQTYAANNHMFISATNSVRRHSSWASFFVQPDGIIVNRLANNRAGTLVNAVDTNTKIYDASKHWRDRAIKGVFHSGRLVRDPRSQRRTTI